MNRKDTPEELCGKDGVLPNAYVLTKILIVLYYTYGILC